MDFDKLNQVLDRLGREAWVRLPASYWGNRLAVLIVVGMIAGSFLTSAGSVLLWIWLILGFMAFPFASYCISGKQKIYARSRANAFDLAWDGRRRLGDNMMSLVWVWIFQIALWVLGGLIAVFLWPVFFAISVWNLRTDFSKFDYIAAIPERLFRGEKIDYRTPEAKLFEATFGHSVPQVRDVASRIRRNLPLDPAQQYLASDLGLEQLWQRMNGGNP